MRIAVNTRFLLPGRMDGIARFTCETLSRLTKAHPGDTFYFLFDRPFDNRFIFSENIIPVVVRPQARHPLLWHIWFQLSVPRVLDKLNPDIFFSPDGFVPLRTTVPVIPVIHDLNFEHFPRDLPTMVRWYYRHYFRKFAAKAATIITVSRFSANDIAQRYHISRENIHIACNGISTGFHPLTEKEKKQIRSENTGGAPYILHTGSLLPRKNIPRLLQAFDLFRQNHPGIKLVLAGGSISGIRVINRHWKKMKYAGEVIFTGRVNEERITGLTAAAEALVLVSGFEGFGLPIPEAMACNVPVMCGNVTALPEVAGKAALLTNPFSVHAIAENLSRIIDDHTLRKSLIELGQVRVKQFSWDKTTGKIWDVISKIT